MKVENLLTSDLSSHDIQGRIEDFISRMRDGGVNL